MGKEVLPKGIRRRGTGYEFSLMHKGKRVSKICDTLEEAIIGRKQAKQAIEQGKNLDGGKVWTLQEAYDRTAIQWAGTKAEEATVYLANQIIPWFGKTTPVIEITNTVIMDYIGYCRNERGNSSATVNRKLSWLSKVLRTALNGDSLVTLPSMLREGKRKEYRGRDRFLSEQEEACLLATARKLGYSIVADVCIVLIDTGMRTGELWKLTRADFNPSLGKHGVISICETKGNVNRSVPLTERAASIVAKRCLTNPDCLFPFNTDWLRPKWNRIKKVMNLEKDEQFVPHCLRHTCASRLVSRGVPINIVQQWLGHSSIQMTARYSHHAPSALYTAMEVLENYGTSDLEKNRSERRKTAVK
jgi:integrase